MVSVAFNKAFVPLTLVEYEMVIANFAGCCNPTRAVGTHLVIIEDGLIFRQPGGR